MKHSNNEMRHENHGENVLDLIINNKEYKWETEYITGAEIKKLGIIPEADQVFLAIKRPWDDEEIRNDTKVNLARPEIEHFFSKKHGTEHLVSIHVNNVERKISRGKHTVAEIKKVGQVPVAHDLEELIDGKLVPLDDNGTVLIKGCEQFFSHVKDGSSS